MVIQCFSDCIWRNESGTRLIGPGEVVTLPIEEVLLAMLDGEKHFKILQPTPLLVGVAICWSLSDGHVRGPAIAQLIEGTSPNRVIAVLDDGELATIHEQSVIDCDPWPAIFSKLKEAYPYWLNNGPESPVVRSMREWIYQHFDDREPWMR